VKLLDVNVVLAASRSDHPLFARARPWLDDLLATSRAFTVPDVVAGSFLRLATHRRVFAEPTPLDDAVTYLRALRDQPGHVLVGPGRDHLDLLVAQIRTGDATGDLVPDAQLAALALEHAAEVVSFDRDFARFPDLRWSVPG
jgi:uncharacterized protein